MTTERIILYDNVCHLCDGSVKFIINHDRKGNIKFAALQSDLGKEILSANNLDTEKLDSLVFVENGKTYTESTGVLKATKFMDFPWNLLRVFLIVPPFIRNAVYRTVAKNRYKWFGKADACMMPSPEIRERFL